MQHFVQCKMDNATVKGIAKILMDLKKNPYIKIKLKYNLPLMLKVIIKGNLAHTLN